MKHNENLFYYIQGRAGNLANHVTKGSRTHLDIHPVTQVVYVSVALGSQRTHESLYIRKKTAGLGQNCPLERGGRVR